MPYVRFKANIPEAFSLKWPEGKEVDSKFQRGAKQIMFTLEDGRTVYLYPKVAAMISDLGICSGEPFSICKRVVIEAGKAKKTRGRKKTNPPSKNHANKPTCYTKPTPPIVSIHYATNL